MNEASEKFHDIQIAAGVSFESENYVKLMQHTADYLAKEIPDLSSSLEIGPGVGVLLSQMNEKGIDSWGVDLNEYSKEYFCQRKPQLSHKYIIIDPSKLWRNRFVCNEYDLVVAIESFEHMPEDVIDTYLGNLKTEWFYFSSTPHHFEPHEVNGELVTEESWGHISVFSEKEWIDRFQRFGYKFIKQPKVVTEWDLLFKKSH